MTTKSTAEHTPELFAALETFIKSGSANGREDMREKCLAYIAALPETAAERDRLREENASLQEALERVFKEVYWFVKRKKNLAEIVVGDNGVKVWADVLDEDLDIARAALARNDKAEGRS